MLYILDYGLGNLGSIRNMLRKVGVESIFASSPQDLVKATKILLPGVGAFDQGMRNLQRLGFIEILNQKVLVEKTPILGICLGMQLFSASSDEGQEAGLGWVKAKTKKFELGNQSSLKIPHMGWNAIQIKKESRLFQDTFPENRFYFVHSYHMICEDQQDVLAETSYGHSFVSAIEKENIVGVQFHPEKSHKYGMQLLKNFAEKFV